MVTKFEVGNKYGEKQVNEVLKLLY
nr:hypothetical protein [Lysinibacillus sphaericus]